MSINGIKYQEQNCVLYQVKNDNLTPFQNVNNDTFGIYGLSRMLFIFVYVYDGRNPKENNSQ